MVVDKLDTTFAALSDPTRRAMVERLSHGPGSVHGLTEPFALSQQMISKHIAYLVRAGIVIKTKRGRERVCTLRPERNKVAPAHHGIEVEAMDDAHDVVIFEDFGDGQTNLTLFGSDPMESARKS